MQRLTLHYLKKVCIFLPYQIACLFRKRRGKEVQAIQHVVHVSPSFFSDQSIIGGGERYAMSLAEAMANQVDTTLVSFGSSRQSFVQGQLKVEVFPVIKLINGVAYDPLALNFLQVLKGADVIHCHQYKTFVTNESIFAGALFGKRVFVTDLGGGGFNVSGEVPVARLVDGFLPISGFAHKMLPLSKRERKLDIKSKIIYGGVDGKFLKEEISNAPRTQILFVGRLLPHKGVNYLIEALDEKSELSLKIVGRLHHKEYFELLQKLSNDKRVFFDTTASDDDLLAEYRSSLVTVLPSVYTDVYGNYSETPELLGLVLLESMACGTPVICTDVGGMPEFVVDGVTGFIVPPNDPAALRERINYLAQNPAVAQKMGRQGRQHVLENFTWKTVAMRCLEYYGRD